MFISVRRCAEPMTQPCRLKVKVTGEGHKFEPLISCQLHISWTLWKIFIKLWSDVRGCAEPMTQPCRLKVKVTVEGHGIEPWISCPLNISFMPGRIFIKLWSNVHLSEMMCRTHNSTMQTQGQDHRWRSQVWAFHGSDVWSSAFVFAAWWMDGWLGVLCPSAVFQSWYDDGRLILKDSVQWTAV